MTRFKNLEKELTSGGWLHFKSFKVLTGNSGKEICDMRPRTFLLIFLKKKKKVVYINGWHKMQVILSTFEITLFV